MFDFLNKKKEVKLIVVIFDKVAKTFGVPVFVPTIEVAKRQFVDFLASPTTYLYRNDFELHLVGYWDDLHGEISTGEIGVYPATLVEDELQRVRSIMKAESGAAVGAEPPQAAERKEV